MLDKSLRNSIIALMQREVVPAVGCTEPAAVSLAVAKATELLGSTPTAITLHLSANIIKNAMGVGIPGTDMIGLPIAIALGALIGRSEYGLEVLRDVCPEAVEKGRRYIDSTPIEINLADDAPSKLHIDVTVTDGQHTARAVISGAHTHFVHLSRGEEVLLDTPLTADAEQGADAPDLNMRMVYDFATTTPEEEIAFILESARLNIAAAEAGMSGRYGHGLGAAIRDRGQALYGNTPLERIICYTSAACDARMGGAPVAVMSNSGSGNQGITATMPVVSFARDCGASREQTIRALTLSHLTSIYIKQSLGRLSALCGCVVASTGASAALVYLMGGGFNTICSAIKNMVANLTGMICDGAKPACSLKIASGVSTATLSAMMSMEGHCVSKAEGIIDDDIDRTVANLTIIGRDAMTQTDRLVLRIMTDK